MVERRLFNYFHITDGDDILRIDKRGFSRNSSNIILQKWNSGI